MRTDCLLTFVSMCSGFVFNVISDVRVLRFVFLCACLCFVHGFHGCRLRELTTQVSRIGDSRFGDLNPFKAPRDKILEACASAGATAVPCTPSPGIHCHIAFATGHCVKPDHKSLGSLPTREFHVC